jgi:hypothetical protein
MKLRASTGSPSAVPSPSTGLIAAVAERDRLVLGLLTGWATIFGILVAGSPKIAVAALAAVAVLTLSLTAPLGVLVLLLALTVLVPYDVQHSFAIGATDTSPGLLISDALLLAGLFRVILVVPHMTLERRRTIVAAVTACFVLVLLVQAVRGVRQGHDFSALGAEFRSLLGFATVLIAMPLLEDAKVRRRLLGWMLALGLALGLWGIAQWVAHINFGVAGDVGVRKGVSLTTNGLGQLQGGLFVYPIATLLALAAILSGQIRAPLTRVALIGVVIVNGVALILTFERAMWVATLTGFLLLLVRAGGRARLRAIIWTPVALGLVLVSVAWLVPGALTTARQRLVSLGQYSTDPSVRYRVVESRQVAAQIRARPLVGSGLAASIHWGQPYARVRPKDSTYSHVGYLWLAWKLGVPGAALLVGLMLAAALWRGPPDGEPLIEAVRRGSQAALLAVLVASTAFPIFDSLEASCTVGLLIAMAVQPGRASGPVVTRRLISS